MHTTLETRNGNISVSDRKAAQETKLMPSVTGGHQRAVFFFSPYFDCSKHPIKVNHVSGSDSPVYK